MSKKPTPAGEALSDRTDPLWLLCGRDHARHTLENITLGSTHVAYVVHEVGGDLEHPPQKEKKTEAC